MSTPSHTIILPRREENRIAIVGCSFKGSQNEAMNAIVKAVTAWVENTYYGKTAWQCSSKDFNIADLYVIVNDVNSDEYESLISFMSLAGVFNLEIEIYGTDDYPANYTYDTVLVEY